MAKETEETTLEKLLTKFAEMQQTLVEKATKSSLSAEALEAVLTRVGMNSATAMQNALKPEVYPGRAHEMSNFNPNGDRDHPKRPLFRKTFLNGHREHTSETSLDADMLTQAEIDAYNDLGEAAAASPTGRLEARAGLYKAELRQRGTELHVEVPVANLDTRSNLPPTLILLLHEIKTGESMMDLNALLEEVSELRRQLNQHTPRSAGVPLQRPASASPTIHGAGGAKTVKDLEAALDKTPTSVLQGA